MMIIENKRILKLLVVNWLDELNLWTKIEYLKCKVKMVFIHFKCRVGVRFYNSIKQYYLNNERSKRRKKKYFDQFNYIKVG